MAPPTIELADSSRVPDQYVSQLHRDERAMRVVELLVAGVALLASLMLSLPR